MLVEYVTTLANIITTLSFQRIAKVNKQRSRNVNKLRGKSFEALSK